MAGAGAEPPSDVAARARRPARALRPLARVGIPFVFAACTVAATYLARLLAPDRPSLPLKTAARTDAIVHTMPAAGRTVVFSGTALAIGPVFSWPPFPSSAHSASGGCAFRSSR